MQHLVQTAISWVQTLDAAMVRRAAQPAPSPADDRLLDVARDVVTKLRSHVPAGQARPSA
jgi:hypothetical protein